MSAIELSDEYRREVEQYMMDVQAHKEKRGLAPEEPPKPSVHFMGRTVFDHVMLQLKAIRSSDLENSLRFLNQPLSFALLFYVEHLLRNGIEVELSARVALFIIQRFRTQIEHQQDAEGDGHKMHDILLSVHLSLKSHFSVLGETIGTNIQGIKLISNQLKQRQAGN